MSAKQVDGRTLVAQNRRARHEYEILGTYEAGIVLVGSEVKSFREGKVQLRDSFARAQDGEVWLHGMHVAPYGYTSGFGMFDPDRARKLLLHKREILDLARETKQGPLTLVPLIGVFQGRARQGRDRPGQRPARLRQEAGHRRSRSQRRSAP